MPKIQVNERDLSWYYRQRVSGALTIFMPGIATFGPSVPTVVDSSNFYKVFGPGPVSANLAPEDISFSMAESFIKAGHDVLFYRIVPANAAFAVAPLLVDDGTVLLSIQSKWKGSFGNDISCRVSGTATNFVVGVYYKGTLVETLTYDMVNPSSQYFYESTNENSTYIEIVRSNPDTALPESSLTADAINLAGGLDGDSSSLSKSAVAQEIITRATTAGSDSDFKNLVDLFSYYFNIIVDGGYNNRVNSGTAQEPVYNKISQIDELYLEIATLRGNAIYLVDPEATMTADQYKSYTDLAGNVNGSDDILKIVRPDISTKAISVIGFNTSYAAAFGPYTASELVATGVTRKLPPSYAFLVAWGQSLANGTPVWEAPAGVKRSSLGSIVRKTYPFEVGAAVLDVWQNHDNTINEAGEHSINPIMRLRGYGYVVYGDRTLLKTKADGSTSVLQNLSVRVLANIIKDQAFEVSLGLQFDRIDDDIFGEFKTLMSVFMDQLKYGGALYDYKIVADRASMTLDDLNSRTVPIRIMISPTLPAENFVITLDISQAGITFGGDSDENILFSENLVTE